MKIDLASRMTLQHLTLFVTPRGVSSHGSTFPYYGGGSYPYGSTGVTSCQDTCNWEAGMMGFHTALANSPCLLIKVD